MMTSEPAVYVWLWLPGTTEPIVAGRIDRSGEYYNFTYGRSYLARSDAKPISEEELPLRRGQQTPLAGLFMAGCIRDGSPDAWGRRVILNKVLGSKGKEADTAELDELTYLLESGSDRIGALDFQPSPDEYITRHHEGATLAELADSAQRVEKGIPLSPELDQALQHGSSVGGARPKALLQEADKKYIAKFSLQSDTYNIVKGEYVAMRLAEKCGIDVAPVRLTQAMGRDVLLIERFDRIKVRAGWQRLAMQSALTFLGLDEMMARYASYQNFAEVIRRKFAQPKQALRELFARLVFNILCGNNDDHARNHAAFWDGEQFNLTPAYDICPQNRTGNETSQAMLISDNNRSSSLVSCLQAHHHFLLSQDEANILIKDQIEVIQMHWDDVCREAQLNETERSFFWHRQFLNDFVFTGLKRRF